MKNLKIYLVFNYLAEIFDILGYKIILYYSIYTTHISGTCYFLVKFHSLSSKIPLDKPRIAFDF